MSSKPHANKGDRRIDEELVSADALKHVLCTIYDDEDVSIHREQNDPPDFTVIANGVSYPAEVTSIVTLQRYHEHCKEFVNTLKKKAISLGILHGKYSFLIFQLPNIPKPKSKEGLRLLDAAVTYIAETRDTDSNPEIVLVNEALGKIGIAKSASVGSTVGLLWTPPAMWEGEIRNQLSMLIQNAVDNKKRKLEKKGIEAQSALLLFYDAFGYAQLNDAIASMQNVIGYEWFHSIFWAASFADRENIEFPQEPGREGHFLFSHDKNWDGIGTI